MSRRAVRIAALLAAALLGVAGRAEPWVPRDAAEVVERLPGAAADRAARRALAERPGDAALAVRVARDELDRARRLGDPRHAGRALAALRAWPDAASAPPEVLLLQATLDQHLHDFDAAAAKLEGLVRRRPRDAQAWLTLATVRRVQGRYAESDRACEGVARAGAMLAAQACRAENEGLRGRFDAARARLRPLLAAAPDATTRGWLATTLAELEQRAGDAQAAEAAWRDALRDGGDLYAAVGYADFLLARGRPAEVQALLADRPQSDAVLLRRVIALRRDGSGAAAAGAQALRARFAQAGVRDGGTAAHARERAMFALWVDDAPAAALALARANLGVQREPTDLWLLARAAQAAGGAAALREAIALRRAIGLVDRRWPDPTPGEGA